MMKVIIYKEIREIISSRKFVFAFLVSSILILLSFYVGARWYENNRSRYEAAKSENLRQMSGITDWIMVNHHIYLPPDPLAALVAGIDNDIGRDIQMYATGELKSTDSRFSDDPIFSIFHFLDIEFIFSIVLALFAILFGYNLINGEKESGTLRLVFAHALPRHQFILGKMTGVLLAVMVPLLIPFCLGCLVLILLGVPMEAEAWLRLAMIILDGMLYFAVLLLLAIFISARTVRSAHAFLLTLIIWIFTTLIIPRVAVLAAGRMVTVPSTDELDSKKFRFRSQLWSEDMQKMNAFRAPETGNPQEMMDAFHKYMGELGRERNAKTDLFNRQLNEERQNRQARQQTVAFSLARLAPSTSFSLAVRQLAGTSLTLKQDFLAAARLYQESYANFLSTKTGGLLPGAGMVFRMVTDDGEEPQPINAHEIPAFVFRRPAVRQALQEAAPDIGILIVFALLFFSSAYVSFLKYDVR
jgi:ABC-type transport system involved in multi-copper enzyme maturation permease subunit